MSANTSRVADINMASPIKKKRHSHSHSVCESPVAPIIETPHRGSILKKNAKYDAKTSSFKESTFKNEKPSKQDQKNGKLTFSNNLTEVKEVDNWKQYNVEENPSGKLCCSTF
jgi:hypothetical protein